MFLGYLNHDENINQWFDSGDLVDIDKDGFLQILGRSKELINVAGNKLLACEVETCIMELEQISDVIVYSKPSLITKEMVVCDVVNTLNKDDTKALIKSHCKAKQSIILKAKFHSKTALYSHFLHSSSTALPCLNPSTIATAFAEFKTSSKLCFFISPNFISAFASIQHGTTTPLLLNPI